MLFYSCSNPPVETTEIVQQEYEPIVEEIETHVPVVMYHYVRVVDKNADPLGWNLSINPEDFEKQLKYLHDNGYTTVHLNDLIDGTVPKKAIVLSFDDGLEDFYTTALPLLKKYGFTASNAIITDMIGSHEHMTEIQIKECIKEGIEITSHTLSHPDLSVSSAEEIARQLTESKDYLKQTFSVDINGFVYPSGKYSDAVVQILEEKGYKVALTTEYAEADLKNNNMLLLPRIRIDNRDGYDGFVWKLENLK